MSPEQGTSEESDQVDHSPREVVREGEKERIVIFSFILGVAHSLFHLSFSHLSSFSLLPPFVDFLK